MFHVLYVEDDLRAAQTLKPMLEQQGYKVLHLDNAEDALVALSQERFDLALLDVYLPGDMDGLNLALSIRELGYDSLRIIFLTARDEEGDWHNIGGNDYIEKPARPRQVIARIKAILNDHSKPQMHFDRLRVDLPTKAASWESADIELTDKEYELLFLFMAQPEQLHKTADLAERFFPGDPAGVERLRLFVEKLRDKTTQGIILAEDQTAYRFGLNDQL